MTTEVTIEDWMDFYQTDVSQGIFAVAEQPYMRLADQLRMSVVTVVTKGKKANIDELMKRIKNTTFYFAYPKPSSPTAYQRYIG